MGFIKISVRDKINNGGYNHKHPYPRVPVGKTRREAVSDPNYQEALGLYNKEESQLLKELKEDLEEEFKTWDWHRKEEAWNFAYNEGYSMGFSEILNWYGDYVDDFFK